jgi:hypothetical protein
MAPEVSTMRHLLPQELGILLTVGRTGNFKAGLIVLRRTKTTYKSNTTVTSEKRQTMNKAAQC